MPDKYPIQYQDVWCRGKLIQQGVRSCAHRYSIIKQFLTQYKRPFTVLDLGANLGYFSFRIAEDFPNATVVSIENGNHVELHRLAVRNGNPGVFVLSKSMDYNDLLTLGACEHFDVVLALSIIHHFPFSLTTGTNLVNWLGDNVIYELCLPEEKTGNPIHFKNFKSMLPAVLSSTTELGSESSHLKNSISRPILLHTQNKPYITKAYWNSIGDTRIFVESNFNSKTVFPPGRTPKDWVPGINLHTFCSLEGIFPSVPFLMSRIANPPDTHTDQQPWNIIINRNGGFWIDGDDPRENRIASTKFVDYQSAKSISDIPLLPTNTTSQNP